MYREYLVRIRESARENKAEEEIDETGWSDEEMNEKCEGKKKKKTKKSCQYERKEKPSREIEP